MSVDDLSGGSLGNVKGWLGDSRFEFVRGDLKDLGVAEKAVDGVEVVFHLAANPEVRVAEVDPSVHFRENLLTTFNVLEAMRKSENAKCIVPFNVDKPASWDAENSGYYYELFMELWIYDPASDGFSFHNRFVSRWLNMTASV
jgi:UDP-glucose 4-epimerase